MVRLVTGKDNLCLCHFEVSSFTKQVVASNARKGVVDKDTAYNSVSLPVASKNKIKTMSISKNTLIFPKVL